MARTIRECRQGYDCTGEVLSWVYWVYTDQSLFELVVTNEHRDVWKIYLEKGKYDLALQYTTVRCHDPTLHCSLRSQQTAAQRDHVMSAQAKAFFDEGRYFQSAQCYAQCSVSFEEVTLKFLDVGERDALRSYITSRLERTRKTVGTLSDGRTSGD